ncbi:MAG TPA: TIGR01777 family oxidoreductase [Gemmatimonadaceae bacterium]|nr:TIGR01777 family oxidoreductase [Gemmatimonadaceae bacterium]
MTSPAVGQEAATLVVAITGSSGMIGSALAGTLEGRGHTVKRLVRRAAVAANEIAWQPGARAIDPRLKDQLEGVDVVINLAGENLAQRWTSSAKRRIVESRVPGTLLLSRTLAALERKPRVLISGSAMGIYGSRGDEVLDESSAPGDGFLAAVCKDWEAATSPASDAGIRVVTSRTTLVLDRHGGAFPRFLLQFRLWAGGRLGDGRQWMSWITLRDLVGVYSFLIARESITGPVNIVAPEPVRNAEFARVLGRVLRRPALLPVPTFALELLLGQMARDTVLVSQRIVSSKLGGYRFEDPGLESAIRQVVGN